MQINLQSHKEIRFILIVFLLISTLIIISKLYSLYQIHEMKKITHDLFEYPFKVSNATLMVQSDVYRIHRDMKDIVLAQSDEELQKGMKEVNKHEQHVYHYLTIIQKSLKDEEGKKLEEQIRVLFREWKPIRDDVIRLLKNNKRAEAIAITKGKGANQVLKLEDSTLKLHFYAQKKANNFKHYSDAVHVKYHNISLLIGSLLLLLLFLISYHTIRKISKHILKNAHLTDVISVIRGVNQLIVREKNKEKLVEDICNILVTNRVYSNAWIVLYNEDQSVHHITSADDSEDFSRLKNKIESGWIPTCIQSVADQSDGFLSIDNTKKSCAECPFAGLYENNGAFSIQLQYGERVYGNLTLSVDAVYLKNKDEISLLQEVAGDISYALYNFETEDHLKAHERSLTHMKELYENIIDSVDNILFVKDSDFIYTVCNQAFEKFVGKSNQEIIGKSDYEIFDKEVADFFREHDIKMLEENKSKSNFEWVTYPDGRKVYLLTVKSPLHDLSGKPIGLVGNSVDITEKMNAIQELKKSQENYQLLANNALDLIWKMDMGLSFTYVNPIIKKLLGYEEEEVIDTKLNKYCSADQFEKIESLVSKMLHSESDDGISIEAILLKKDGSEIPLEVNGKIIFDETHTPIGFQGAARDFTLQSEAREKLKDALGKLEKKTMELQTILQEAPNPIMLHNEAGEVLMVNKVWQSLSGYTFEEINTVAKWAEKACDKNKPLMREYMETLYSLEHKIDMGEASVTTKEGNTLIWQFSSAPLGIIDGKQTVVTTAMDITELKKKDKLMMTQSRHAAMGEMIGMIAHQWRQPIAGIAMDANNMMLDIAFETFDATTAEGYAKDILDQTQHLSKTIDDFRNFFKPDKSVVSVHLEDIMNETLNIVKESLANNGIAIKTLYASEAVVDAYPRELMQVFVNIINNAKDSLLSNHTKNALIDIHIYDEESYVCTKVCDNGGGITETVLPKLFDPYFSTKDEKTGTGLGLYMSKMIIEEHLHGIIDASNNEDGGACFQVRLLKKCAIPSKDQ